MAAQIETVTYENPVKIGGKEVTEVTIRRPFVRDMVAVGNIKNDLERDVRLIANLTDHTYDEIAALEWREYAPLQEKLADFLS